MSLPHKFDKAKERFRKSSKNAKIKAKSANYARSGPSKIPGRAKICHFIATTSLMYCISIVLIT